MVDPVVRIFAKEDQEFEVVKRLFDLANEAPNAECTIEERDDVWILTSVSTSAPPAQGATVPPGQQRPIAEVGYSRQMLAISMKIESFQPRRHVPQGEGGTNTDTVGYGHLMTPTEHATGDIVIAGRTVNVNNGISQEDAGELMLQDIPAHKARFVPKFVPGDTPIGQAQFDALISFVLNTGGLGWVARGDLYKFVSNGQWDQASDYVRTRGRTSGGVELPGLVGRRNFEADMIRFGKTSGDYLVNGRPTVLTGQSYDEQRNAGG